MHLLSTVATLQGDVFYKSDISKITLVEENPYFTSVNNSLYSKDEKTLIKWGRTNSTIEFLETLEIIRAGAFSVFNGVTSYKLI